MRNPQGYAVWTDPNLGVAKERDTFTCSHCNNIVFVKPQASATDMGGWCGMCAKAICKFCVTNSEREQGKCLPFEKKMEAMERRDRLLRAVGGV
jgi:hypothetical protein